MTKLHLLYNHAPYSVAPCHSKRLSDLQETFRPSRDFQETFKRPSRPSRDFQTFKRPSRDLQDFRKMTDANVVEESAQFQRFVEHPIGYLEFSAYKYHHNRNPYCILFIKCDSNVYIEMINDYTHRHKIVTEIVMPFEVMEKNEYLKRYYDLSVRMVNTRKSIYYDTVGVETKHLIQTYDTDSDTDEDEEKKIRRWAINCDCVWKNLRVSKNHNIYYNMNPFTYSYDVNTGGEIEGFMRTFDAFAKYNLVPPAIEAEILALDS